MGVEEERQAAMIRAMNTDVLPAEIVDVLTRIIRRSRRLVLVRGLCITLGGGILAVIAAMTVDAAFLIMSAWVRVLVSGCIYASVLWCCFWFIIRPLRRSYSYRGIARMIEEHHPEMHERISSAIELLTSSESAELKGSGVLIAALANEAVKDTELLKPRHEIRIRELWPFFSVAGVLVAALLVMFAVSPVKTSYLLARVTAPFANLPNIYASEMQVEPGDRIVLAGERLEITASVLRRNARLAEIRRIGPDGRELVEDMDRQRAAGVPERDMFSYSVASVASSFRYRVRIGDAVSRYYQVTAVAQPEVRTVDILYDYPEYTGRDSRLDKGSNGSVAAPAGTKVAWKIRVNKEVASAVMAIDASDSSSVSTGIIERLEDGSVSYLFSSRLNPGLSGVWSIHLKDEYGFRNARFERPLMAQEDRVPEVKVINLVKQELRLNRKEKIAVNYTVKDDVGIDNVAIEVSSGGKDPDRRELYKREPAGSSAALVEGGAELDLSEARFKTVPSFSFWVAAGDVLPAELGGPHRGCSAVYKVTLDDRAEAFAEQVLDSQYKRLTDALGAIKGQLEAARKEEDQLVQEAAKNDVIPDAMSQKMDKIRDSLNRAESEARDAADEVKHGYFEKMADQLEELANNDIAEARSKTDRIRLTDEKEKRVALAEEARSDTDKALAIVDQLLKEVPEAEKVVREAVVMDRLAREQQDMVKEGLAIDEARRQAESAEADKAELAAREKSMQASQKELAREAAELIKKDPEAVKALAGLMSEKGLQLEKEAAEIAKEQDELRQAAGFLLEKKQLEQKMQDLVRQQKELEQQAAGSQLEGVREQAERMKEAARQMERGAVQEAGKLQKEASGELEKAEQQLRKEANTQQPGSPEQQNKNAQAEAVDKMGARQDQIMREAKQAADRKEALEKKIEEAVAGVAEKQKEIAEQIGALAEKVKEAQKDSDPAAGKDADTTGKKADPKGKDGDKTGEKAAAEAVSDAAEKAAQAAAMVSEALQGEQPAGGEEAAGGEEPVKEEQPAGGEQPAKGEEAARKEDGAAGEQPAKGEAGEKGEPGVSGKEADKGAGEEKQPEVTAMQEAAMKAEEAADQLAQAAEDLVKQASEETQRSQDEASGDEASGDEASGEVGPEAKEKGGADGAVKKEGEQPSDNGEKDSSGQGEKQGAEGKPAGKPEQGEMSAGQENAAAGGEQQKQSASEPGDKQPAGSQEQGGQPGMQQDKPGGEPGMQDTAAHKGEQLAELSEEARQLARQQESLARAIEALSEEGALSAMAELQQGLADEIGMAQEQAEAMAELARQAFPGAAAQSAQQAAQHTGQAEQQAAQASKSLSGKDPSVQSMQAGQAQQQAARDALNQAGKSMKAMQSALGAQAQQQDGENNLKRNMAEAAEAAQAAAGASEENSLSQAVEAAANMRQAAEQAASQAQAMGMDVKPAQMQMATGSGGGFSGKPEEGEDKGTWLGSFGKQLRDWLSFHKKEDKDVVRGEEVLGPEEYRSLIRKYFEAVSRQGEDL